MQCKVAGIHTKKAFLYALVLTNWNLANSQLLVKNKATERPMSVAYIVYARMGVFIHSVLDVLYTYTTWGYCVARFDKQGNARASIRGTSDELAPRFFCLYRNSLLGHCNGSLGRGMKKYFNERYQQSSILYSLWKTH